MLTGQNSPYFVPDFETRQKSIVEIIAGNDNSW